MTKKVNDARQLIESLKGEKKDWQKIVMNLTKKKR